MKYYDANNPYANYSYPASMYYQTPVGMPQPQQTMTTPGTLPLEQSYIENILRMNLGKKVTIHMTFEGNNTKIFKGRLEAAGKDHIIISDPETGHRNLLLMIYLDYVTFDEKLDYSYPYPG